MFYVTFFGISDIDLVYSFIFLGILASYFIMKPLINIILTLQLRRLLHYILSSLLFFTCYFGAGLWLKDWQDIIFGQLKFTFQLVALFGGILLILYIFREISRRV
ncbi:MAG TPA: hypothetical protein VIG73_13890 [Cerasibacillus sp.]|uniref:hypothetical protein n=1 Tax=Cerasibacillus sp. TaxID=2498711 RepID=UPI002F3F6460